MADEGSEHPSIARYVENYGRMRDLLELVKLPARGPRGSRVNQRRARMVQAAVHQLKVAGAGFCEIRKRRGRCTLCKFPVVWEETRCAS